MRLPQPGARPRRCGLHEGRRADFRRRSTRRWAHDLVDHRASDRLLRRRFDGLDQSRQLRIARVALGVIARRIAADPIRPVRIGARLKQQLYHSRLALLHCDGQRVSPRRLIESTLAPFANM